MDARSISSSHVINESGTAFIGGEPARNQEQRRLLLLYGRGCLRRRGLRHLRGLLGQLLDLEAATPTLERVTNSILTVVVIQVGARLFGVLVDSVFRTEEIVVKPMSNLLP
jgi:chemotaxis protein histidine kinase CheA